MIYFKYITKLRKNLRMCAKVDPNLHYSENYFEILGQKQSKDTKIIKLGVHSHLVLKY
jgi:hypothetical protein